MTTDDDLKNLVLALAPFMVEAVLHKHSMVQIDLEPTKVLGIAAQHPEGAGRIFIAAAAGPSRPLLKDAVTAALSSKH